MLCLSSGMSALHGQELRGEVVYVAEHAQTYLTFAGTITAYDIDDRVNFTCRPRRDNAIIIIPKGEELVQSTIVITEGERTHQFRIVPRPNYDPNKESLYYDYSDLKKLKSLVKQQEENAASASSVAAPVTTPSKPAQPTPAPVTNTQPPAQPPVQPTSQPVTVTPPSATDEEYLLFIAEADKQYAGKDYEKAKANYTRALAKKPNEAYPAARLETIERLLAILNSGETERIRKENEALQQYNALVAKADSMVQALQYTQAKLTYYEALKYRPSETYPKNRIKAIDDQLELLRQKEEANRLALEKEAAIQKAYADEVEKADAFFNKEQYDEAAIGYAAAQKIKPEEAYPANRLTDIANLKEAKAQLEQEKLKQARQREIDTKYKTAVAKGDKAFSEKKYADARVAYKEAMSQKPSETYPQQRIDDITNIEALLLQQKRELEEVAVQKAIDNTYDSAITKADNYFKNKAYEDARLGYSVALKAKPNEIYPQDQLNVIDAIMLNLKAEAEAEKERLAKEKIANEQFQELLSMIKKSIDANDLTAAEAYVGKALAERPTDPIALAYNKNINDIKQAAIRAEEEAKKREAKRQTEAAIAKAKAEKEKELEAQRQLDAQYAKAVADGEAAYKDKRLEDATRFFNDALSLKPGEEYPKQRLQDVQALEEALATMAKENERKQQEELLQQAYNDALLTGDQLYNDGDWAGAIKSYNKALSLKPEALYIGEKIQKAQEMIDNGYVRDPSKQYLINAAGDIQLPVQTTMVPLTQAELFNKYPRFDFRMVPFGQRTAADYFLKADTLFNYNESINTLLEAPVYLAKDSIEGLSVQLVGIHVAANNVYFRLLFKNFRDKEWLVGRTTLVLYANPNKEVVYHPVYTTGFPYLLPGKQIETVFATRLPTLDDDEHLILFIIDRTEKVQHQIFIEGKIFNEQISK